MKMLQKRHRSVSYYLVLSSCGTDDFQLLRSPPMMINGRSPVWHARCKKLLHMFNRWTNNFARIGTAYLHLTAGYTDIKMLIAKDLLLKKTKKKKTKKPETNV